MVWALFTKSTAKVLLLPDLTAAGSKLNRDPSAALFVFTCDEPSRCNPWQADCSESACGTIVDMADQRTNLRPSVNPSDEQVSAWESLNREEQLASMRAAIEESSASGVSSKDAAEVFQEARDSLSSRDA